MLRPRPMSGTKSIWLCNNGRGAEREGKTICSYSEAKKAANIQKTAV